MTSVPERAVPRRYRVVVIEGDGIGPEGLYIARGLGVATQDVVADTMLITRRGCERVARFAFDLATAGTGAPRDHVRRVTCVDKANVLRGYAFFREVVTAVSAQYPEVE